MSFWDRYLAPGDVRSQRQPTVLAQTPVPSSNGDTPTSDALPRLPVIPQRIDAAHRARRQNALFFGGLGFTFLSLFITRRAMRRRLPVSEPTLSKTAVVTSETGAIEVAETAEAPKVDGGFEAVEALFLATLNVAAVGMTAIGAFMKIMDVADVEDLREIVKKNVGYDVYAGDSEGDKEVEAWVADILARKDVNGGEGGLTLDGLKNAVAGKLGEMIEQEKKLKEAQDTPKVVEIKIIEEKKA